MLNIAIIGAGICGLTVAHRLQQFAQVTVFEKSRGLGGRMATRYTEDYQFDHGVPYFSASDHKFLEELQSLEMVLPWKARFIEFPQKKKWQEEVFVASPRMNAWAKYLALDLSIQLNTRVEKIEFVNRKSRLYDQTGVCYGPFDWLISTLPWPQAKHLLADYFVFDFPIMQAQKVYMFGFEQALNLDFDVARFDHPLLDKLVVNSAKPGRGQGSSIVVYSYQQEDEKMDIEGMIQDYLPWTPSYRDQHFWRYAQSGAVQKQSLMKSKDLNCIIGGDWLRPRPGIEASYMVAQEIIASILS